MIDISKVTSAASAEPSVKGSVVALLNALADAILGQRGDVNPDPVTIAVFERIALQIKENLAHLADAVAKGTSAETEEWAEPDEPDHPPPLEYDRAPEEEDEDEDLDSAPDDEDEKPKRGRKGRRK